MIVNSMQPDTSKKSIKAPRGTTISCKGWIQEAALRMLKNYNRVYAIEF